MSNEIQNKDPTPPSPPKKEEAVDATPAVDNTKKKRSAGNQLTKDDYDAGDNSDDGDEGIIKHGFKRASDDVLKNRKIYKVKRTVQPTTETAVSSTAAASTNGTTVTDADKSVENGKTDDDKTITTQPTSSTGSSNPFAATTLVAKANSDGNGGEQKKNPFASTFLSTATTTSSTSIGASPSTKKVFGFGSGGYSSFGSTKSAISTSNGTEVPKVSGFGGGFAGIGSGTSTGKPSGFGSATGNAKGWFDGSTFGNPTASPIQFNFKSNDNAMGGENGAQLPVSVELTTGEEDEKVIHEGRCKSFVWVLDSKDETKHPAEGDDATDGISSSTSNSGKANLSVKPSTEFQTAISSNKTNKDETATTTKVEVPSSTTEDEKEYQNNYSTEATNENKDDEGEDKEETITEKDQNVATSSSSPSKSQQEQQHRWQELGIGPMKILRSTKKPDRFRLVQRRESSKNGPATKVILNVPLWKETTCERDRQAQQYLRLKTFENGKVCTYSFQFKENTDAGFFQHYMTDHIPDARECFAGSVE